MAKILLPNELAEIVTGLLVKPELLGEEVSVANHQQFIKDIGDLVADNFGGYVGDVSQEMGDSEASTLVSVYPNENLPSLHANVWSLHDTDGWIDENVNDYEDLELGEEVSTKDRISGRDKLQSLLLDADHTTTVMAIDLSETPLFKSSLTKLIDAVNSAASNANVSPKGFTIDESLSDYGKIEVSEIVSILDEVAGFLGDYGSTYYRRVMNRLCESLNQHFS